MLRRKANHTKRLKSTCLVFKIKLLGKPKNFKQVWLLKKLTSRIAKTRFRLLSWRESLLNPPRNNWTSLLRTRNWRLFLTNLHRENAWWIKKLLSSFAKIATLSKEHAMRDMLTKFSWELERNNRVRLISWSSWTRLVSVLAREIWCTRLLRRLFAALLRKSHKGLTPNQTIKARSDS